MPITAAKAPKTLPKDARKLWADTFNGAFENSCQGDTKEKDECAAKIAWSNIQRKYRKVKDTWVKKSEVYHDILLTITKASLQPDGSIRWQAVTSDTEPDRAEERTSLDLFNDWIERATYKIDTPWLPDKPRTPFLGLSHYPSLDGFGEAGITRRMYVDGNKFKADGVFYTDDGHPVGKQLLDTIKSELALIKKGEPIEQPVRISAGWWDIEHYHSDSEFTFTRQSLLDKCPLCEKGQTSDKVYRKGQLDHFAATRVPMNPRTSIELEEKSMAKTRKEDASTIVDTELAEQLDQKAKLIGKSEGDTENELPEAMVIRQDDEDEQPEEEKKPAKTKEAMKTVKGEKYPAGDFLVVEDSEVPSTWHLQVKRNGKADHTLMGAAWAALHEGSRGNKYEGPDKDKAISALTKLYKAEDMETPTTKADVEKDQDKDEAMEYRPLGGAVTLDDAEAYVETRRKMGELHSHWDMFRIVVQNIMTADDEAVPDKVAAMSSAVENLGDRIDSLKAGLADAFLIQEAEFDGDEDDAPEDIAEISGEILMSETQTTTAEQQHPVDVLRAQVEAAMASAEGRNVKEATIQDALNAYTDTVKAQLDQVAPPDPTTVMAETLKAAMTEAMAPLAEKLGLLSARLEAQPQPVAQGNHATLSMPVQKSLQAGYQPQPVSDGGNQLPTSRQTGKPSALTAMVRRSVGLQS